MVTDLSKRGEAPLQGLMFRNDAGDLFSVAVHDKFPQLGDVHVEGRRYV